MSVYKEIDELQTWIRENQAKASDADFKVKVERLRELMAMGYESRVLGDAI